VISEPHDLRVIFIARDYEETVAFYRDVLELPVLTSWNEPPAPGTIFSVGGATLEVLAPSLEEVRTDPSGFRLLLRCTDPDALCQRLQDKGAGITVPLVDRPWGYREFAVRDPNGIQVFFYTMIDSTKAGHR